MKNNKSILKERIGKDGKRKSPRLPLDIKNFLIDIDGVISEDVPNEEPERMLLAKEIPGAKKQINQWYKEGNIITFFTSRTKNLEKTTEKWLKKRGFKYHGLICGKPRGGNYHYIDDATKIRATRFEGKFGKLVYKNKKIQVFE
ncbi:MAG TPA: phosphoheptose isomerase [Candidatus Portnoybacteria bacterium]|nr:phosphoheptose isomerase [Candidatus Portnoybacteria bacterium]